MKNAKRIALMLTLTILISTLLFTGCGIANIKSPASPASTTTDATTPEPTTPTETTAADEDITPTETTTEGEDVPLVPPIIEANGKQAQYNMTLEELPYNWNLLANQSKVNEPLATYVHSVLFDYDYKFDGDKYLADGSINADAIVPGAYTVHYSAASKLEDVTALVDAKWGYTAQQKAEGGYAWKITLRNDLKWDDGTPITAADFVYSMQAQLDPAFMYENGEFYYDTLSILNAGNYFRQNQDFHFETVENLGYKSVADAIADGMPVYINVWEFWGAEGAYFDCDGNRCPEWLSCFDETVYVLNEYGGDLISGKMLWDNYGEAYLEVGKTYHKYVGVYQEVLIRHLDFEDVGCYSIDEENAIVLCFQKPFDFLTDDGSLSYQTVELLANLPLVKKELYEANKCQPQKSDGLWTSTYNTGLKSGASWGPYKLVEFYYNSSYRLEKNPYWYGWNMECYRNQYNISAINAYGVNTADDALSGLLDGRYDEAEWNSSSDFAKYYGSEYMVYTPDASIFGLHLFGNLEILKKSQNNNGILAIQEFRQALSLALNRDEIIDTIWQSTGAACLGALSNLYYYDVQNGGVYRYTAQAKAVLLRAYGYTEQNDGTWSVGELQNLSLDEAYRSLTGYLPALAQEKMAKAIEILNANADYYGYDASKKITIVYGASADTAKQRARAAYLQGVIDSMVAGTVLEGKIEIAFGLPAFYWTDAFRNGETQIGFGWGFNGEDFVNDPFNAMCIYVDPTNSLNFHPYWNTAEVDLSITLPAGNYDGAGQTITMSVLNWCFCLNGLASEKDQLFPYNWDADHAPIEARLAILAALEEVVLKESYYVALMNSHTGSMLSAKVSYITNEYNAFMGFGGLRYMVVNYSDEEWDAFCAENNFNLSDIYAPAK